MKIAAAAVLASLLSMTAAAEVPLIPRQVLFGPPQRSRPQLSPDGLRMAWLAPDEKGVGNVFVETIGKGDAHAVTQERHRAVQEFTWAGDGKRILYFQDGDGDENAHLFAADLEGKNVRDLTPFRGVKATNLLTSPRRPNEAVIALNLEDRGAFDLYRIDLATGAIVPEARGKDVTGDPQVDVLSWTPDANLVVRGVTTFDRKSGRTAIRVRDDAKSPWREIISWSFDETSIYFGQAYDASMILNFEPDGKALDVVSSAGSDKLQVVRIDAKTGKQLAVLIRDPKSDPAMWDGAVAPVYLVSPATSRLQGVAYAYLEPEWHFIDDAVAADFRKIAEGLPGFVTIVSRDGRDRTWIVTPTRSDTAESYYLFDRSTKKLTKLFDSNPELGKYTLARKEPVVIRSRDGLELVSYVSYPPGAERKNLPLILVPHGGPWVRDHADYDSVVQLLANRGYAVLQVNYRGSEGLGRRFVNAATRQWGLGTNDDLLDAVQWAIAQGIADPKRIAALGGSGGGYATLRLLTEAPERFVCGVDFCGPADVKLMIESFPPYWGPSRARFIRRIGDVIHDEEFNRRISPLYHIDQLRAPLLVFQGATDPRVPIATADLLVKMLRDANREVTYVVYPDEGHGFRRPENNIDMATRVEEFLARHLGGRAEPARKVEGTTAELR